MNFVAHFCLAKRDLASPAAAVGAMLPDLWRMIDRRVRPHRIPIAGESRRLSQVLAGVDHHARADTAFHTSAAFYDGERRLIEAFRAIEAPRLPLFAHVAWELCIDGALLRRDGPAIVRDLGTGVAEALEEEAGETAVAAAARAHHTARKGEPLEAAFHARVAWLLGEIAKGPWVTGYARGDEVAARLDGIRSRLGLQKLEPRARLALAQVLDQEMAHASAAVEDVLALEVSSPRAPPAPAA